MKTYGFLIKKTNTNTGDVQEAWINKREGKPFLTIEEAKAGAKAWNDACEITQDFQFAFPGIRQNKGIVHSIPKPLQIIEIHQFDTLD